MSSGGALRRNSWGIADQGLSSLTQLVVAVLAARSLAPGAFGGFAAAMALYLLALAVGRAICGEVLTVRHATSSPAGTAGAVLGAAVLVGAAVGLPAAGVGLAVGGPFGESLAGIGVLLAGLLLQDGVRYVHNAAGRPSGAFAVDLVWAGLQAVGFAVLAAGGELTLLGIVLVWAGAGAVAGAVGAAWLRVVPSIRRGRAWIREGWDLGSRFTVELLVTQGAGQLLLAGVGLVAGTLDAGALRGVQVLYGPLTVLLVGARFVGIPDGARLAAASADPGAAIRRRTGRLAVVFVAASVAVLGVLAVVPDGVGEAVLGDTWAGADALIVPFGAFLVWEAGIAAAAIGLRSLAAAGRSLQAALTGTLLNVSAGVVGSAAGGVRAGAWVLAGSGLVSAAVWWRQLSAACADATARAAADATTAG